MSNKVSARHLLTGINDQVIVMFTNWVEDETLFEKSWEEVLPLSEPFVEFIKKLFSREGFATCAEALEHLYTIEIGSKGTVPMLPLEAY